MPPLFRPTPQGEAQVVLTLEGQQVPATVRPAAPELAGAAAPGAGQALEVQLPHRILLVRDSGGSSAHLVHAEVDGEGVALQVLASGPRQLKLQHCGAQRVVCLDGPLAAQLTRYMPPPTTEDYSKARVAGGGGCSGGWGWRWGRRALTCTCWAAGGVLLPHHSAPAWPVTACPLRGKHVPAASFTQLPRPACLQVIRSPMPGTLVSLGVQPGQRVDPGDEVRREGMGGEGGWASWGSQKRSRALRRACCGGVPWFSRGQHGCEASGPPPARPSCPPPPRPPANPSTNPPNPLSTAHSRRLRWLRR